MVHIQWKDRYNINFREIDAQHRGLLDILNELMDLLNGDPDPDHVTRIFHRLCD
jgi:hemerythrin